MVKKGAKGTSFRLKQDAVWMLEDLATRWECTQTAAVERAILQAHESPFSAVSPTSIAALREMPSTHRPEIEQPPPDTRPKNATCRHCGQRFAGPKYATVCAPCQADGHINTQPADCRKCQEGFAA